MSDRADRRGVRPPLGRRCAGARSWRLPRRFVVVLAMTLFAGCATGPRTLTEERLAYNEAIKATAEQQMLLNIVRLRYTDTPSSLSVTSIAIQTERVRSIGATPFFGVVGSDLAARRAGALLPQAQVSAVDRPTITMTPADDQEFTRKLFTPMTLDAVLYLAKTTWPISTVFRLWLENLNWVPNAESASGPANAVTPEFERFEAGIAALQSLQNLGLIVFGTEERFDRIGGPMPAARVMPKDLVEAAREGLEWRPDGQGATWSLTKRRQQPVMRVHPHAAGTPDMRRLAEAFRLEPGLPSYDIGIESLDPFPANYPAVGVRVLDLETRSLLQVMYFLSKSVVVPAPHARDGSVRGAVDADGKAIDWERVTRGLMRIAHSVADEPPANAHVAVRYRDHWFYIDRRDHDSLSTLSLVVELARLELAGRPAAGPALTLPLR